MPRITFPNRDRHITDRQHATALPKLISIKVKPRQHPLHDLIQDRYLSPQAFRQAIARLPAPTLNRAWGELSSWECELAWDIYRSGQRGKS